MQMLRRSSRVRLLPSWWLPPPATKVRNLCRAALAAARPRLGRSGDRRRVRSPSASVLEALEPRDRRSDRRPIARHEARRDVPAADRRGTRADHDFRAGSADEDDGVPAPPALGLRQATVADNDRRDAMPIQAEGLRIRSEE